MKKYILYKEVEVVYDDRGQGACILLLHGYLETAGVWESFTGRFLDRYRVITMDLPGHGGSGTWGKVHSMEDLAGSVCAVIEQEGIDKVFLVGHSLGGYVAMAFADLYPHYLSGYSLFHSTCFADSEEKRDDRDREIRLVMCKRKRQIILVNIPKGFADMNLDRLSNEVEQVKNMALSNSEEGIVAILKGMKERQDRTGVLQDPGLPLLLIGGMKDNYIPGEVFERLVNLAPHASVVRLLHSGHMGFIEEPEPAAAAIRAMVKMEV